MTVKQWKCSGFIAATLYCCISIEVATLYSAVFSYISRRMASMLLCFIVYCCISIAAAYCDVLLYLSESGFYMHTLFIWHAVYCYYFFSRVAGVHSISLYCYFSVVRVAAVYSVLCIVYTGRMLLSLPLFFCLSAQHGPTDWSVERSL